MSDEVYEVHVEPQKKSFIAIEEHPYDPGFNIWSESISDKTVFDLFS